MDKQFAIAVVLIILGVGMIQGEGTPTILGFGYGVIVMGSIWVAIRLIKEIKQK